MKQDITSKEIIKEQDIKKIDIEINKLVEEIKKIELEEIDDEILHYKNYIKLLLKKEILESKKNELKIIYDFQQRTDHGFFSTKTANENLLKSINCIESLTELDYQLFIAHKEVNVLDFDIIDDLNIYNEILIILCEIIKSQNIDISKNSLIKKIDKCINEYRSLDKKFLLELNSSVKKELSKLLKINKESVTRHIISKEIFELIKKYIELFESSIMLQNRRDNDYIDNLNKNNDMITSRFTDNKSTSYGVKIEKIENIKCIINNIIEKYKTCIKEININDILNNLKNLQLLDNIKYCIEYVLNKQKDILKSFRNQDLLNNYISQLSSLLLLINEYISMYETKLTDYDIDSYIELFDNIESIEKLNNQLNENQTLLESGVSDAQSIAINNKITALTIKVRRLEDGLSKNNYFDYNKMMISLGEKDKTKELSERDLKELDKEIINQNEQLLNCFNNTSEIEEIENLLLQYNKNKLDSISFIEYLLICDKFILAKFLIMKQKFLELLYDRYLSSDIEISFEEYIETYNNINIDEIIKEDDVVSFELQISNKKEL